MTTSELVLVCGDMHLGSRVAALPPAFAAILLPGKMAHVLCTGNGGIAPSTAAQQAGAGAGEALDFLRSLAPRIHTVRGDCDDDGASCISMLAEAALRVLRQESEDASPSCICRCCDVYANLMIC